jgi:hypothetical protein
MLRGHLRRIVAAVLGKGNAQNEEIGKIVEIEKSPFSVQDDAERPVLTVVVVVYRMAVQAERTLASLAPGYQQGADPRAYEIVVVENQSPEMLGEARARAAAGGATLRYVARAETQASPVGAVHEGAALARGTHLAIMIDGARMLSPGVVAGALAALRTGPDAVVSVPGYHLGHDLQQVTVNAGHDAEADRALLEGIGWPADGYRLFDIAVLSGSCRGGFFRPQAESNFLVLPVALWNTLGGMDRRYADHGGGMVNIAFYRTVLEHPGVKFYLLHGEGTFHQFHGGVTTNTPEAERVRVMTAIVKQDEALRGDRRLPATEAILFGRTHPAMQRFLRWSLERVQGAEAARPVLVEPEQGPESQPVPADVPAAVATVPAGPRLSVVVIVYDMVAQAMRTLHTLSTDYQRGVTAGDYEVIVVENRSARCLDPAAVAALPGRFRYVLRDEAGVSPAPAINAGLALAQGATVGLMIDGARMLTPGVIAGALAAARMNPRTLVGVPGYQLGPVPHNLAPGRVSAHDDALLAKVGWPGDGYRLFDVASLSLANRMGFFRPFMECNCLFAPADAIATIGGADERFDLAGGGALNLWLWHRLAHYPGLSTVVLPGEGSVHQVHGGVTTTTDDAYADKTDSFLAQLNAILGEPFKSPDVEVTYLGALPQTLAPFLAYSTQNFRRPKALRAAGLNRALATPQAAVGARPHVVANMPAGPLAEDRTETGQDGAEDGGP